MAVTRVIQYGESPEQIWDEWLNVAATEAGLGQSTYWARVIQRVDQAQPIFLSTEIEKKTVGQLLLFHKPPFDRQTRQRIGDRSTLWRDQPDSLEFLDGPVLNSPENARAVLKDFLKWIEHYALTHGIGVIRSNGFAISSRVSLSPAIGKTFERFGYKSSKWATLLVDLTDSKENLWRRLDYAARKCIKKCARAGVIVRKIVDCQDYADNFQEPYAASKVAQGLTASPLYVQQIMFEEDVKGYNAYFVAESQDRQVLATLGLYIFNGVATEMASALTPAAHDLKISAQDLLHWEIIKYAKANGCHSFNLAGIAPEPGDAKEAGIRRFKQKWGGRYVEYSRYEKVMPGWRAWNRTRTMAERVAGIGRIVIGRKKR